jgi:hypothetical protein
MPVRKASSATSVMPVPSKTHAAWRRWKQAGDAHPHDFCIQISCRLSPGHHHQHLTPSPTPASTLALQSFQWRELAIVCIAKRERRRGANAHMAPCARFPALRTSPLSQLAHRCV